MSRNAQSTKKTLLILTCLWATYSYGAGSADRSTQTRAIDAIVQPLQQKYAIPGIAVAVTVGGKQSFYNYGVMSKATSEPVTPQTLFEIGSFSKTFTATLACYAEVDGKLSLSDSASQHLPALRGSRFDQVSLLNLATHTSGLPLFVPDSITNNDQLMAYFRASKPDHPVGTYRIYSNLGIGMLGMIAASSMNLPFDDAIEKRLLPELGMTHSYINVPASEMKRYAQGYTKADAPVRVNPGMLSSEAYGLKSSTSDLIRFLDANMQLVPVSDKLRRAIACTHTGYYKAGAFIQDLVWEEYPYPVALDTIVASNSPDVILKGMPATALTPPLQPQPAYLLGKTGSTNGFSTYAAFIPAKKIGVVILANKSFPLDARVTAAYDILESLGAGTP
ncbi:class C beta-lactamase [Paraburkholderia sp.]|uniref:class C beta-lactamase n=1 Tax=Paraburkholderia sp. TaxID=1926495 RepID=UPI003D6E55C6